MSSAPVAGRARTVALVAPDLDGRLRTRNVPAAHFDPQRTPCFADIVFAFDAADQLIPRPAGFAGWWPTWSGGFGDLSTHPDEESRRTLAWRDGVEVVFADLRHADGTEVEVAPRQLLRRLDTRLRTAGSVCRVGTELEFFLHDRAGDAEPTDPAGAYDFAPPARDRQCVEEVVDRLLASGIGVSSWYTEGGARQYEIALAPADPVAAADATLLARYAVAELATRHGLRASFHPKPGAGFGSGLHVHLSLYDSAGANLLQPITAGPDPGPGGSALAGVLSILQPATAVFSPTPEGYLRLAPHTAAGTTATWAHDNRSAGIRFLDRGAQTRWEMRCAASDAHPHLVVAAMLAGIEHGTAARLALPPAGTGDVYAAAPAASALPGDLASAAHLLAADPVLTEALGGAFVAHYAATRVWAAEGAGRP